MIVGVTAEQEELRASVRRFLADRAPLTRVRELMETEDGTDRAVWEQASAQLGLPGLAIPQGYGGAGFTFAEQAIVLLVPSGTVSTHAQEAPASPVSVNAGVRSLDGPVGPTTPGATGPVVSSR